MPEIGQIIIEQLPAVTMVALCGEHDLSTVPTLQAELDPVITTGRRVVVDLSEATFIDSSIVGALFHAATPAGRLVAIAATPGTLPRRFIDMVNLTATIPVFDSPVAAVAWPERVGPAASPVNCLLSSQKVSRPHAAGRGRRS